ncbi:phage tail protein [Flavobacterium macacae]|uniref:Phage tail protein n=1 Tax=Flavobacterium macacae TaxID=2488993 RepID=A0A3P3W8N8_9FLAO|nr:tail fiber protein [Flavobacterium macacae]RRJ91350.1 phage tail protein [Flavobacterium macacae]
MDEYLGIIKLFAGTFVPQNYLACNGQLLPIQQYAAVFSLLGTTYGGDGVSTFALPDLRSRIPVGTGQGPGLSNFVQGQKSGTEQITLLANNLPAHNHPVTGSVKIPTNDSNADAESPDGAYLGTPEQSIYSSTTNGFAADAVTQLATGVVGNNVPVSVMQPYLALNYIICVNGVYPSRP